MIERTLAGEQCVLPGAEKATDATLAQRLADAPLRPKREQVLSLGGLFGDSAKQVEMF
jgi:hypothetical protein